MATKAEKAEARAAKKAKAAAKATVVKGNPADVAVGSKVIYVDGGGVEHRATVTESYAAPAAISTQPPSRLTVQLGNFGPFITSVLHESVTAKEDARVGRWRFDE